MAHPYWRLAALPVLLVALLIRVRRAWRYAAACSVVGPAVLLAFFGLVSLYYRPTLEYTGTDSSIGVAAGVAALLFALAASTAIAATIAFAAFERWRPAAVPRPALVAAAGSLGAVAGATVPAAMLFPIRSVDGGATAAAILVLPALAAGAACGVMLPLFVPSRR